MGDRIRNEDGLFLEKATLDDVREAVRDGPDPVSTTGDVAAVFNISSESARGKLNELHEQGRIERRKIGARAIIWWVQDD